jgi:hypothetical protein
MNEPITILGLDLRHAEAAIATLGDLMLHFDGDLDPHGDWSDLQKAAAALAMEARAEDEDEA